MGDIATHDLPVWRSRANFLIMADLTPHGMSGKLEQLWARRIGDRAFEICCIPFFTYGIALGDSVETNGDYRVLGIVNKGGHRNLRVAIVKGAQTEQLHEAIHGWLDSAGFLYEWRGGGYAAVDLSFAHQEDALIDFIRAWAESGQLQYELNG
jgi:hypothetical protein